MENGDSVVYYVYAKCADRIKIGTSKNVSKRVKDLDASSPESLILLATEPGSLIVEKKLHIKFREYRVKGEWFQASQEIKDYIDSINNIDWNRNISRSDKSIMATLLNTASIPSLVSKETGYEIDYVLQVLEKLENMGLVDKLDKSDKIGRIDKYGRPEFFYVVTKAGEYECIEEIILCQHCGKEI